MDTGHTMVELDSGTMLLLQIYILYLIYHSVATLVAISRRVEIMQAAGNKNCNVRI